MMIILSLQVESEKVIGIIIFLNFTKFFLILVFQSRGFPGNYFTAECFNSTILSDHITSFDRQKTGAHSINFIFKLLTNQRYSQK